MKTEKSNHDYPFRQSLKLGDLVLVDMFYNTKFFTKLLFRPTEAIWSQFLWYLKFSTAAFACIHNVFYRRYFGHMAHGAAVTLFCFLMILSYNSVYLPILIKPLGTLVCPLLPIWYSGEELWQMMTVNVHSQGMMVFAFLFLAVSLTHTVMIWFKKGNKSSSKRGDSWLYDLISRKFTHIDEFHIQGILEPLITLGIAALIWEVFDDQRFAIFLGLCGISEGIQQLADFAEKAKIQSVIDM